MIPNLTSYKTAIVSSYKELRVYSSQAWMLFLSRFLIVLSFSLSMFYFSIYLSTELHVSSITIGFIIMLASLAGAGAMMLGGMLSDRFGRKPVMSISTIVRILIFFFMAYVIRTNPNVTLLTILYICSRISGSIFLPASDAVIADIIEKPYRIKAYSLMRVFANGGFALGPAIGGIIAEYSYVYLFLTSSFMSIVVFLFIHFFIKESAVINKSSNSLKKSINQIKGDYRLITFCSIGFAFFVVMGQFGITFSLFVVESVGISKAQFGQLFFCNGLLVMILQYPMSMVIDSFNALKKLQVGLFIYALGFFTFGFANSFASLTLSVIVITFGEMIFEPTANAMVSHMAPPDAKGSYMGTFGLTRLLGWTLAPLIGGFLLKSYMHEGLILWGIIGLIGLSGVIGFIILEKTFFKENQY